MASGKRREALVWLLAALTPVLPANCLGTITGTIDVARQHQPTIAVTPVPDKTVSLTFDDGPGADTPAILNILVEHHATATFFIVGDQVPGREHVVTDLVAAGMGVQWHTQTHADLTGVSPGRLTREVNTGEQVLSPFGVHPSCLRPPYGASDDQVAHAAADAGLEVQLWNVDPQDWAKPDPSVITARVLDGIHDGDVVLLHDGGGDRSRTVQALPGILSGLADRGFGTRQVCTGNHQ